MIIDGPYMTIDPKPAYLTTGQYTLTIGTGLASTYGETLAQADDIKFSPLDSTPKGEEPAVLVQHITDSQNGSVLSPLSGAPVNVVAVKGTLLGENGVNSTQADAVVHAELADPVTYTNVLPIRIPKGTVLNGSSIDIKIGGHVDAGYDSGKVTMTLLSDATGYLVTNPYSHQADAPRIVHLFMDVGITTEDPRANGGFTQDILHIELVGTSKVDTDAGVLDLDAISVVQPDVLGQEYGYAVLSFQLKSYRDQTTAPKAVADTTPPTIQSWMPGDANHGGDHTLLQKPGDPIIVNFDEPLDPQSVQGQVTLYRTDNNGVVPQDVNVTVDGAAIVIKPKNPLVYSEETNPISYELQLGNQIADVMGNKFAGSFDQTFSLAEKVEKKTPLAYNSSRDDNSSIPLSETQAKQHAPFILGLYPGYPCVFDATTTDLSSGFAGRCSGGIPLNNYGATADDLIPLMGMPANRPIIVVFSKDMDVNSIRLGKTFKVRTIDSNGNTIGDVSGKLTIVGPRQIRFWPNEPWQNGQLYQYTLVSNGDITSSSVDCVDAICGGLGLPLQTQLLANVTIGAVSPLSYPLVDYHVIQQDHLDYNSSTNGGPDMVQYFKGIPESKAVLQILKTAPISDVNSNLIHDADRTFMDGDGNKNELRYGSPYSQMDPNTSVYNPNTIFDADYQAQESGPTDLADPNTQGLTDSAEGGWGQLLDPEGILPAPNSAKIISTLFDIQNPDQDWPIPAIGGGSGHAVPANTQVVGASVGCSYQSQEPVPSSQVCSINPFTGEEICHYNQYKSVTDICPREKFTYLNSVLFAEVEPGIDSNGNIPVKIYPGHVVTTSFTTFGRFGKADAGFAPVPSGYQVMRMRYTKDANGDRVKEVPASISESGDSLPQLTTSLDLYLNAPLLYRNMMTALGATTAVENFFSYPSHFDLAGAVSFLSDGRMMVSQRNTSAVPFHLRSSAPVVYIDLEIPKNGSYLQYVSEPIKP